MAKKKQTAKKKKNKGYRAALFGAKGTLRFLVYLLGACLILYLAKTAYDIGYQVFNQQPVAKTEAEGEDVVVVIENGASTYAIGKLLRDQDLIEESPLVFWLQTRFSDFYGKLETGTYILNTHQTVDEMLEILAQKNTEGQPKTGEAQNSGTHDTTGSAGHVMEGTEEGGE